MVEGHSVHRIAVSHTQRLVGKRFAARSPNGRFAEGAKAIHGREFSRIEAIGKNLFAFFSCAASADVVMHVHFGMSGRWSVADARRAPETKPTTRLVLEGNGLVSHLSAMTVDYGTVEDLYEPKRAALGQDPLRSDADPDALWRKVGASSKSIGALLMDQSCFAGVGNIFRAEILLVAGIHPETPGKALTRAQFDTIWDASVRLMGRAFALGSIVTVSPEEAAAVGKPSLRRWIYNSARCGKCGHGVKSWDIQSRTCYACERCQPRTASDGASGTPASTAAPPTLFNSHCAAESLEERLKTPVKLRVAELRAALSAAGLPTDGKKAVLVERLQAHMDAKQSDEPLVPAAMARGDAMRRAVSAALAELDAPPSRGAGRPMVMRSARAAAADKAAVRESRAVEHIAELDDLDDGAPEWIEMPSTGGGLTIEVPSDAAGVTTPPARGRGAAKRAGAAAGNDAPDKATDAKTRKRARRSASA